MKIGVPKESAQGETRVALVPSTLSSLLRDKHEILVERGAGVAAASGDEDYVKAGARVVGRDEVYAADVIVKVQPPLRNGNTHEASLLREGSTYIGFLAPLANAETVKMCASRKVTTFSMEYVPRISRAQSMDALSSMATVAGYKAVMIAADHLGKMFPLLMTAAGTVPPANVVILGAGVAGLQAIATARRLGGRVEAFDPRAAVKEQVKSLGAGFIDMEMPKDAETTGGYAKELSDEFLKKEQEAIATRLPKAHVVITTAQVFGKKAPVLITADMVKMMPPGAVIVDLAAEQGGNCELTQAGKTIDAGGVSVIGAVNLPAAVPVDASSLYARNVVTLFRHLYPKADAIPDFNDEIVKGACITRNGEIVNEQVRTALG